MSRKSKKTDENQVIDEVTNEINYYEVPDEAQCENVISEDAIEEEEVVVSGEKVRFFESVQTLAQIVEDMQLQGKLSFKQSHDAYECFETINALINEI